MQGGFFMREFRNKTLYGDIYQNRRTKRQRVLNVYNDIYRRLALLPRTVSIL